MNNFKESDLHVPLNIIQTTSRNRDLESKIRKRCNHRVHTCICAYVYRGFECFPWLNRIERPIEWRGKFASRGRNNDGQVKVKKERERERGVADALCSSNRGHDLPSWGGWKIKRGIRVRERDGTKQGVRRRESRGSISLAYLVTAEISIAIDIGRLFENESVMTRFHASFQRDYATIRGVFIPIQDPIPI